MIEVSPQYIRAMGFPINPEFVKFPSTLAYSRPAGRLARETDFIVGVVQTA